jgi:hypothetical protein
MGGAAYPERGADGALKDSIIGNETAERCGARVLSVDLAENASQAGEQFHVTRHCRASGCT